MADNKAWWKFWEGAGVPTPPQSDQISESAMNEQVASHLIKLSSELEAYKTHGTSDPVLIAQSRVLAEALRNGSTNLNYQVAAAYGAVYTKVATTRKLMIQEVDKMSMFYLVDVLISQLTEDSMTPEIGTGDILEVSSERPDLQREIDFLEAKFDFDQLVLSIVPDIIRYGEYTLRTKVKPKGDPNAKKEVKEDVISVTGKDAGSSGPTTIVKKTDLPPPTAISYNQQSKTGLPKEPTDAVDDGFGLIDIQDTVEQGTVVALTQYNDTLGYLALAGPGKIRRHEPADFVKFSLASSRIRIDLHKEFDIGTGVVGAQREIPKEMEDIPRYIRVGKSIIAPIMSKLKELELLEALVPATKLAKLSTGTVVGVQVPSGYDIQKAMEAAKQVEGILNKRVGVDPRLGELTIENIMNTAGRIKVVPIFGDKGQLSRMDYQSEEPDELLAAVKEIREVICSSIGVPYEILFGSDGESKGQILKKYARYLRKLKAIQKAVEEGVREIVYIHLVNKGYQFTNEEIKVSFYNKLIEIDNLDKLEFIDTTVGLLKNAYDFVLSLADPATNPKHADKVKTEELLDFINKQLNVIGFNDLIAVSVAKVSKDKVHNKDLPGRQDRLKDQNPDNRPTAIAAPAKPAEQK